ncbi:MAG: 16S rRNA (guanine(966)-N(2))-methyltransferase RsmD [Desulfovibrionaceae bacterium]
MKILSGIYKGRKIKSITAQGYRPAMAKVRAAIFSMLEARGIILSTCRVLDLFAGSGSLSFEALSRGAKHVTCIESNKNAVKCIQATMSLFSIPKEQMHIHCTTVEEFLRKGTLQAYDLIFMDPPYHKGYLKKGLVALVKNNFLHASTLLVTETEPDLIFTPNTIHPKLLPIADSSYGQTRVHIWIMKEKDNE